MLQASEGKYGTARLVSIPQAVGTVATAVDAVDVTEY